MKRDMDARPTWRARAAALMLALAGLAGPAAASGIALHFVVSLGGSQDVAFYAVNMDAGNSPLEQVVSEFSPTTAHVHGLCNSVYCRSFFGSYALVLTNPSDGRISSLVTMRWGASGTDGLADFDIHFASSLSLDPGDAVFQEFPVLESIVRSPANYCQSTDLFCERPNQFLFHGKEPERWFETSWLSIVDPIPEPGITALVLAAMAAAAWARPGRSRPDHGRHGVQTVPDSPRASLRP